jgi:hypothetical protein
LTVLKARLPRALFNAADPATRSVETAVADCNGELPDDSKGGRQRFDRHDGLR